MCVPAQGTKSGQSDPRVRVLLFVLFPSRLDAGAPGREEGRTPKEGVVRGMLVLGVVVVQGGFPRVSFKGSPALPFRTHPQPYLLFKSAQEPGDWPSRLLRGAET